MEKGGGEELGKRGGQALKGGKTGRARVKGWVKGEGKGLRAEKRGREMVKGWEKEVREGFGKGGGEGLGERGR